MATFFMLRLVAVLILIAFAFLLHFLGELWESKPVLRDVRGTFAAPAQPRAAGPTSWRHGPSAIPR